MKWFKRKKSKPAKVQEESVDPDVLELVDTFKNATGLQLVVEGAKWVSIGAFMGMSDAIPGYSGGTTLAVLGVFKKMMLIAKSVFFPEPGITRLKAIMFMIPFAIGWIGGIYGFAKLTEMMAHHGFGLQLIIFFSTFILFAIPVFLMAEKPNLWSFKGKFKLNKTKRWFLFGIGLAIIVTMTVLVATLTKGVDFGANKPSLPMASSTIDHHFYLGKDLGWMKLMLYSFLGGMVTIIPGGSGAIVQLLSNMYDNIHWKIMAHPTENIYGLMIFGAATFVGMAVSMLAMAWGLKRHQKSMAAFSLGMLTASVVAIYFIPKQSTLYANQGDWQHILFSISSVILAVALASFIAWKVRKKQIKIRESLQTLD